MLGTRLAHCSRLAPSSSSASVACLHSSAAVQASAFRARKSRVAEKANIDKRAERQKLAQANRPHVVLGTRPGDDAKWLNCDLAKVLISEEDIIAASSPPTDLFNSVELPKFFNYGVGEREKELLFESLPALTTEASLLKQTPGGLTPAFMDRKLANEVEQQENFKANMLARLTDLRNANARGIAYENRKRCIAAFSEPGKPDDTGRPEVQAALLTYKIRNLWDHLSRCKKDISNRRSLRKLVHDRAKILKYLKRIDRDRYDRVLERLGLEPESVEGELVV